MTIDKNQATLIAASIAAIASIIGLFINAFSKKKEELREINRKSLEPHVIELGETIHEVVVSSALSFRDHRSNWKKKWHNRSMISQKKLREIRPKVRYQLWGIDDALRLLIRFPEWVSGKNGKIIDDIIHDTFALKNSLDNIIQKCYRYGRLPTLYECLTLKYKIKKIRKKWKDYIKSNSTSDTVINREFINDVDD